jgi:hypothetical protein
MIRKLRDLFRSTRGPGIAAAACSEHYGAKTLPRDYSLGVVLWADSKDYVRRRLALNTITAIHQRRGYSPKLLCLEGFEHLRHLNLHGHEIVNCEAYYRELCARFKGVAGFYICNNGLFFLKNIFRWALLREFCGSGTVNVDGDLVLNSRSLETLADHNCCFFYPDSTCFVVTNNRFYDSYWDILDRLNFDFEQGWSYIRDTSRKDGLVQWGLSDMQRAEDLDEERLGRFIVHAAGLYNLPEPAYRIACPPFLAHCHGVPPLGRYMHAEFDRFRAGVSYSYVNDCHFFADIPLLFMHYQSLLHFRFGAHALLDSLRCRDEVFRCLPTKDMFFTMLHDNFRTAGEFAYLYQLIWNAAVGKLPLDRDYWDANDIIDACENGGALAEFFNPARWHHRGVFSAS